MDICGILEDGETEALSFLVYLDESTNCGNLEAALLSERLDIGILVKSGA